MADIVISGNTSGSVTLRAPDTAGTTVLTLPTTSGTLIVSGGAQTIEFADGTVSAPSITNSGDTNTGIYFPAADTIAFTEGGVESMRINSSGNLGIGTDSIRTRLDVRTGSNAAINLYNTTAVSNDTSQTEISSFNGTYWNQLSNNASSFVWKTYNDERMRIDSSGNVGIGTDSPAFASGSGLEVQRAGDATVRVERTGATNSAGEFVAGSGLVKVGATSGSPFAFITDNTERMRIASSGDVLIGGTTSSGKLTLQVSGTTTPTNQANLAPGIISLYNAGSGGSTNATTGIFGWNSNGGIGSGLGFVRENLNDWGTQIRFYTHPTTTSNISDVTERMRVTSGGNVLFGCIATPSASVKGSGFILDGSGTDLYCAINTTVSDRVVWFYNPNGLVGGIVLDGSSTIYSTSSDYRLKENIAPMTGALAKVAQLKPVTYNWKVDGSSGEGFIAHELQEVIPNAVNGEKDAVNEDGSINPQGIDTSFLVATLTAAIQELNAKVTALEAQLGAK